MLVVSLLNCVSAVLSCQATSCRQSPIWTRPREHVTTATNNSNMRLLPPAVHVFKHHAWSIGHSQDKVGDVLARQAWCDVTHVVVHRETAYVVLHMTHKHVRSVMLSVQICANVDLEVPPEVRSAM